MAMAKIWRNRIEAGTQMLSHCPAKYREMVIELIRSDLESGSFSEGQLRQLVQSGMMTAEEYKEITGEDYE